MSFTYNFDEEKENFVYRVGKKPLRKQPFGRLMTRWEGNVKPGLRKYIEL
jgi:hypothetical protein